MKMFVLIYYASIITRRDVLHESNNFLKLCDVRIDNKKSKRQSFRFKYTLIEGLSKEDHVIGKIEKVLALLLKFIQFANF